jgi:ActR/RegA family two-component response regulator
MDGGKQMKGATAAAAAAVDSVRHQSSYIIKPADWATVSKQLQHNSIADKTCSSKQEQMGTPCSCQPDTVNSFA